ncbi:hypothetical protein KP509_11G069800 [Ceratopteris richardii]|uniref:Uncharacterized protein n=1 Tax=Ceratopteris richardii TaxID=49495 RepID=A0A8T2TQW0_CERRI|nr:hypothetical protein KP509_11G069800 [Ceratopteris richardii]
MADKAVKCGSFSVVQSVLELEDILGHIFSFINDCSSISLVCKKWYNVDSRTRKKVTVTSCYAIDSSRLTERFQALQALKIRGKPRAAMFRLVPDEWGGYARPWITEISRNCTHLNSIYLRRMVVTDEELSTLVMARGRILQVLKLVKCSGFSTDGLKAVATHCRVLRVLCIEECTLEDHSGNWLHELSQRNSTLESLNISGSDLQHVEPDDLLNLTLNCQSLVSLKLNDFELEDLREIFRKATALQELGGVSIGESHSKEIILPSRLTSLVSLAYNGIGEGDEAVNSLVQPIATGLKKIDLQFAFLSVPGHCELLGHCSNLEALEVFNAIGDEGLDVIASHCKKLRWLRVERGDREVQQGFVTQRGLISVALNCHQLEYIAVYVTDINNAALKTIAANCPNLTDFRLVLLDEDNEVADFPLDDGVRDLMQSCPGIHHFALYLRPGFLTDKGMEVIGMYGGNLKWTLFGLLGESDRGIELFAKGCPKLKRLEIRDCVFSERAIASAVQEMEALNYVWVQGYNSTGTGRDLLPLTRKYWNVELIDEPDAPAQFVAYRCLSGKRTDAPPIVTILGWP